MPVGTPNGLVHDDDADRRHRPFSQAYKQGMTRCGIRWFDGTARTLHQSTLGVWVNERTTCLVCLALGDP